LAGAYTSRDHRGDPNGRPPFVAVSAARQREALAFIADAGLGENVYRFRPELLSKLAPERWYHWGANPFSEARIDFPLHDGALGPANALDGYTQAHFADSRQRIDQALNAQVVQQLGPTPPTR